MTTYAPIPGDIGLVKITGTGGRLIRVGQWLAGDGYADFQHAFVYVGDGKLVEAMPGGARITDLDHYTGQGYNIFWLRCPPQYGDDVAQAAISFHGVPYAWTDYFAIGLHRFHIPAPHLKRFIARRKSMICSQLADAAAERGGWHIFADGRWSGAVTPGDLFKAAVKSEGRPGERYRVSR